MSVRPVWTKEIMTRVVAGIHACREALKVRDRAEIQKVLLKEGNSSAALKNLAGLCREKAVPLQTVSARRLSRWAENHQGAAVFVSGGPEWSFRRLKESACVLVLSHAEDPRNLGAVMRSAWLTGCDGLFVSRNRSLSALSPAAHKAASGAAEHIPVSFENTQNTIRALKREGFWIYGLSAAAEDSLWEEKFEGRTAFVLGGEGRGLSAGALKLCDRRLSIPQTVKEASYNVSAAAALALGERRRQIILCKT